MRLRGYQERTIRQVDDTDGKAVLVAAPTGAGKGTMAAHLLARHAKRGERGLFLVHRREIVKDIAQRIQALGAPTNVLMGGSSQRNPKARVDVVTVQALLLGDINLASYDLAVIDEAHHYAAQSWLDQLNAIEFKKLVGFSATPARADGRPLDMFDRLVISVQYSELLRDGYIVPTRVLRPPTALGADLAQEPADAYFRYTKGATAFVFVPSIELAERTAQRMTRGGAPAVVVNYLTHDNDRDQAVADLKRGRIKAIVNVDTMTEGVDVPNVNAVILARACHHTSTYLQTGGRGMRPDGVKKECVLLDLSGASYSHGRPDIDRAYSLEGHRAISFALRDGEEVLRRAHDVDRGERREAEIVGLDLVEYSDDDQMRSGVRIINWDTIGLGKEPDAIIAARLGVSETTVLNARRRRGIAPCRRFIDWEAVKFDKRDEEIAAELGCSRVTVAHARKARGIRMPGQRSKNGIDWATVPLGTRPDSEIAEELGCSIQSVYHARKKRGVEAHLYQKLVVRGKRVPIHRGGAGRKLDFSREPLGEVKDASIAESMGCSVGAVKQARQVLGIPPYSPSSFRKVDLTGAQLGVKPDRVIARQFKCSEFRVWTERKRLGIPPFRPQNAPKGDPPAAVKRRARAARQRRAQELLEREAAE